MSNETVGMEGLADIAINTRISDVMQHQSLAKKYKVIEEAS
jgi:hypothetical protein